MLEPTGSGQFSLAAMVGNTGYLGYPITLALQVLNTLAGRCSTTALGAYGLGVALAAPLHGCAELSAVS